MGLLQINVLGSSFAIQAKEDDEYLKKLLSYYKQIIAEIDRLVAFLYGLNEETFENILHTFSKYYSEKEVEAYF